MPSQACAGFAARESLEATTKIDYEDEEDPGMEDAEEGAIMFYYLINFSLFFS
jgi:hypothetical protein